MSSLKKKIIRIIRPRSSLAYLDQRQAKSRPDVQRQSLDLSLDSDRLAQTSQSKLTARTDNTIKNSKYSQQRRFQFQCEQ